MHAAAGDGGDVDDGTLGNLELFDETARQHQGAEEIDLEDGLPVGERRLDGIEARAIRPLGRYRRIVDERVQAPALVFETFFGVRDSRRRVCRIGEINLQMVLRARLPGAILGKGMS